MWICPVLRPTTTLQPFSPHGVSSSQLMVDIGIYGRVPDNRAWQYTRQLDLWAIQNQARKMVSDFLFILSIYAYCVIVSICRVVIFSTNLY